MTSALADRFVFDPFAMELIEDPYPSYRMLRDRFPVYFNPDRGLWFLSRFEDVQAAARDHERFASGDGIDIDDTGREFGEGVLIDIDPPKHDLLRRVVRAEFTPKALAVREQSIRDHIDGYLTRVLDAGGGDAVADITWRLAVDVTGDLLGVPMADRAAIADLLVELLERIPGESRIPESALAAGRALRAYFTELVEHRRKRLDDGLMSTLIQAEGTDGLTPAETEGLCLFFFVAGTDTPSDFFSTMLYLLDQHPDQRAKLVHDHTLLALAVEEALRYDAPFHNSARTVRSEVEIRGTTIPRGSRLVLLWASANRDERRWPDADRFDIEREPMRHLSLGEGIHFCLGAALTRIEARTLLEGILERMPNYSIVDPMIRTTKQNRRGFQTLGIACG